jgi:hypothetical protein
MAADICCIEGPGRNANRLVQYYQGFQCMTGVSKVA